MTEIKKRSNKYWEDRYLELEKFGNRKATEVYRDLVKANKRFGTKIKKEMLYWLTKFAGNNEISVAEAKELINDDDFEDFKYTVEDYIREGSNPDRTEEWERILSNMSARYHIKRQELLRNALALVIDEYSKPVEEVIYSGLEELYKDSYYRSTYTIGQGLGVEVNLFKPDTYKIRQILNKPWTEDGIEFSKRIWGDHRKRLVQDLYEELTDILALGRHPKEAVEALEKRFNVQTRRIKALVYTESAHIAERARTDNFKDLGVEKYIIVATLDQKTSDICRDMDGKVFGLNDLDVGVNAPPFHVHCRTTKAPFFEDDYGTGKRAARDKNGKTVYVPEDMTYKEWYKKHVESDPEYIAKEKMWKNRHADKKQFKKYKKLSNKVPRTLEDFQEIKYNVPVRMNLQLLANKDLLKQSDKQIVKGIRSNIKQIEKHKAKVINPHLFDLEFKDYTEKHKEGLVRHWKKEIKNFKKNIEDSIEELEKRGVDISEWKNKY